MTDNQTQTAAQHAHPAFHLIDLATDDATDRHQPQPNESRKLRLSILASAAALVALVLAASVSGPIKTAGTQMEPGRFQASTPQQKPALRVSAVEVTATRGQAGTPPHR